MASTLQQLNTTISVITIAPVMSSSYDLPLYGINNGQFYYIHIPASYLYIPQFIFSYIRFNCFFQSTKYHNILWTKSERFFVYLAICDALFNVCHSMDHLHIVISKNHVYPKGLCAFYGFMLAEFITAQNLMANIVSINAFVLIYFRKNIDFWKWDWKLLLWTFGLPFMGAIIAGSADTLGPNGTL